jgi:hypothetical protein
MSFCSVLHPLAIIAVAAIALLANVQEGLVLRTR